MRPVGIAVVGCGRIASAHIDAITSQPRLAALVAVMDSDMVRARAVAARHANCGAFDRLEPVLELAAVEAVILCTPNALHCEQALEALARRRHVLVEKPMAEQASEAASMARAARQADRVLAIGQTLRHHATIRYLQDHLAEFGTLHAAEVSQCVFWDGPQAAWWKYRTPEQGLILSLFAPHALDFIQLIMGDDPLRVHVEAARHQSGWRGEDEAMILLGYPGRRMASVHISYNQRQVVDRKTLFFDRGVLRIEDGETLFWNEKPVVRPSEPPPGDRRRMGGRDLSRCFRLQLEEFVRAVRGLPHRSVLHEEGARLVGLLDRVKRSARINAAGSVD